MSLTCAFQNADRFEWYKDSNVIANTENLSPLIINTALAGDQGYYFCVGRKDDGSQLKTDVAVLRLKGENNPIYAHRINFIVGLITAHFSVYSFNGRHFFQGSFRVT